MTAKNRIVATTVDNRKAVRAGLREIEGPLENLIRDRFPDVHQVHVYAGKSHTDGPSMCVTLFFNVAVTFNQPDRTDL